MFSNNLYIEKKILNPNIIKYFMMLQKIMIKLKIIVLVDFKSMSDK